MKLRLRLRGGRLFPHSPEQFQSAMALFYRKAVLEQFTNEMNELLCRDLQENPCHEMRAGRLLPAVREHFEC